MDYLSCRVEPRRMSDSPSIMRITWTPLIRNIVSYGLPMLRVEARRMSDSPYILSITWTPFIRNIVSYGLP
jgi:hypothetical protein